MRDILKNIFYKSIGDDELLFKINTGDTPEEKRKDGIPLESENTLKLPKSLLEERKQFPSSSSSSSSQPPLPTIYPKPNKQKEEARKKVYSILMTYVKNYL